jgi:signal transduction histidine kinase
MSIRVRLLFSYTAIALLAVLALGGVLLVNLRGYYLDRESEFLENNAQAIQQSVIDALSSNMPREALEAQLQSLAFLSQVRMLITDASGALLIDSGVPSDENTLTFTYSQHQDTVVPLISVAVPQQNTRQIIPQASQQMFISSFPVPAQEGSILVTEGTVSAPMRVDIPTSATLYGFRLNAEPDRSPERSDVSVAVPVINANGEILGTLILSEGPAYGRQIVDGVARGWAAASVVSVLLAVVVSIVVSRRITAPLHSLTHVTARMTNGDLSARARIYDADEFGALARSFNGMAARVETTVTALRRFVADAAHELNTPITALRTNLELALENPAPHHIARAREQLDRLRTLADSLLDLSRIEAVQAERQSFDFAAMLRDLAEYYASQAEQADVTFTLSIPDSLPVCANESQMRRMVGNLLDNAIKFTPACGRVDLRCSSDETCVDLTVADSGIGIPSDDLPALFSRFHRGRNTATYPGSGLGLTIVKLIVEGHGGKITVYSKVKSGTTVRVSLPIQPTER